MRDIFRVATESEDAANDWLICFGTDSEDNKNYWVVTDHVHASELYQFSQGARADAELVRRLLNGFYKNRINVYDEYEIEQSIDNILELKDMCARGELDQHFSVSLKMAEDALGMVLPNA